MKKMMLGALLVCSLGVNAGDVLTEGAALGAWTYDVEAAQALAKTEGKYLFIDFTGSDWCHWCQLMDEHVLSKSDWMSWAATNLVLAIVDHPQDAAKVPEKYRKGARALDKQYKVEGFPTYVMLGPDGHEAGRLGASRGGNEWNFITNVIAVIVEDKIVDYVTPEELATYREAQAEKAAWDEKNEAAQAAFHKDFAVPYHKANSDIEVQNLALMKKATDVWRVSQKSEKSDESIEIQFADFGAGVVTNGARLGAWTSNYGQAMTLAKETGRDLFVAFVGPKWCDWGNEMESNVFNTAAWMNFAAKHFVLVYIDCPGETCDYLSDAQLTQNARLYHAYGVRGCPCYILADSNGKRYESFGATSRITPEEQIQLVETLLARKELVKWLPANDYTAYTNLVARKAALDAKWRDDYDAFINDMDEQSETFAPIAEKRNTIFKKALEKYFKGL